MARQDRTTDLNVTFTDRYVQGWTWAVGDWFSPALDIQSTQRVIKGRSTRVLTQGVPPLYQIRTTDMFWKGPSPYRWNITTRTYSYIPETVEACVQVDQAIPDSRSQTGDLVPGFVKATMYKKNPAWHGAGAARLFLRDIEFQTSQIDFVRFLRTGQLAPQDPLQQVQQTTLPGI